MALLTPADSEGRIRPCDDLHGAIVVAATVLSALAYTFYFSSFLHAKELIILLGLALIVVIDPLRTPALVGAFRFFLPLGLWLLWATVSGLFFGASQVGTYTAEEFARLSGLLLFACFAYEVQANAFWRERILNVIAISAVIVAALALGQLVGLLTVLFPRFPEYDQPMYSVFGNQDLLGGYLALGVCLVLYRFLQTPRNDPYVFGAMFFLVPALVLCGSRTAWLAAAVGVLITLWRSPKEWPRATVIGIPVTAVVLLLCAFLPEMTVHRITTTFSASDVGGNARLWFWDATVRMIGDRPALGVGLGNFKYHSPFYQGEALHAPGGEDHYSNTLHTLHAHSDPLEILAETGLIGLALIAWMIWRMRKLRGPEWGGIAALLVFACFNATYTSAPHLLAGLLLAGSLSNRNTTPVVLDPEDDASPWPSLGLLAVASFTVMFVVWTTHIPSYRVRAAERAYDDPEGNPLERFRDAASSTWPNYPALEAYAVELIEQGDYLTATDVYARAHEGIDTGRVWFFHGVATEYLGDIEGARALYRECLFRWPRDAVTWARLLQLSSGEDQLELRAQAKRWLTPQEMQRLF